MCVCISHIFVYVYEEFPQNAFGMTLTQYPEGYCECELRVNKNNSV